MNCYYTKERVLSRETVILLKRKELTCASSSVGTLCPRTEAVAYSKNASNST
jgi:hypothetical protein